MEDMEEGTEGTPFPAPPSPPTSPGCPPAPSWHGGTPNTQPSLELLEQALRIDREQSRDRICAVFNEGAGWRFGCPEQTSASVAVQNCLTAHEALAYRPMDRTNTLPDRHEFRAMVHKLLQNLGVLNSTAPRRSPDGTQQWQVGSSRFKLTPEAATQQKLEIERLQRTVAEQGAALVAQGVELVAKDAALAQQGEVLATRDATLDEAQREIAWLRARLASGAPSEGVPPAGDGV